MFAYPCPSCSQRLQATPERVGQRTICPKCLSPIVIPRTEEAEELVQLELAYVPPMSADSPSTIFVDDFAHHDDDADAMDLSLPDDAEEFAVFGNDSAPYPEVDPASMSLSETSGPSRFEESYSTPAASLAAMGLAAPAAVPQLSGVGAGPAAYVVQDTPMPRAGLTPPKTRDQGVVVFHSTPEQSADIAADLTAALTMRMKPPPEPPSDLRLSTGAWLGLNATGLSLWMLSMMRIDDNPAQHLLTIVGVIGILEIVISYVWIAYISGRRDTKRGFEALLPPVWIYRLAHPAANSPGFRPLRYTVAGILLIALAMLGARLRPTVQQVIGEPEPQNVELPKPLNSPLSRLQDAQEGTLIRPITDALAEISSNVYDATPEEAPKLLAELRKLRLHPHGEVRAASLIALKKRTSLDAVKPEVVAVLLDKSSPMPERQAALDIAQECKDREIARALAYCLTLGNLLYHPDQQAAKILSDMGPPEAEDALLEFLENEDSVPFLLPDLLAKIGTERSLARLKRIEETARSSEARVEAPRIAEKIANKLEGRRTKKRIEESWFE